MINSSSKVSPALMEKGTDKGAQELIKEHVLA
jgi:hypothetical protein